MRVQGLVGVTLSLVAVGCLGPSADDPAPRPQRTGSAIVDGTPDEEHRGVVGILRGKGLFSGVCTGTLITPDAVLTAHHCVAELVSPPLADCPDVHFGAFFELSSFRVFVGNEREGAPVLTVREILAPRPDPGSPFCGNDLALLRLSTSVSGAQLAEPRLDRPASVGETFTAVGFGYTAEGATETYGKRLARASTVGWVGRYNENAPGWTVDGEWGTVSANVCNGDSGGPAFDADGRILGIASRTGGGKCTRGIYQGLGTEAAWLRAEVAKDMQALGLPLPRWAEPPPAPPDDGAAVVPRAPAPPPPAETTSCAVTRTTSRADAAIVLASVLLLLRVARRRAPRLSTRSPGGRP